MYNWTSKRLFLLLSIDLAEWAGGGKSKAQLPTFDVLVIVIVIVTE
jgi:hypothetical protein